MIRIISVLSLLMFTAFAANLANANQTKIDDKQLRALAKEHNITPIKPAKISNPAKVALGKKLYHDTMLSGDNTISCASCHMLDKGGTDQLTTSKGIKSQLGPINSPTVYNSAGNFVQFWNGRAKDLKEQALGPVENPLEMGDTWDNVVKKISENKEYKAEFDKLYKGKITKENVVDAIAAFEETLATPDSDFDLFLKGKDDAISADAKQGFAYFVETGCVSCHNGSNLGGNSYQPMPESYFKERGGKITDADLGRFTVTKDESDKFMFKVPMLRNIEVTPPYFHDGKVKTLDKAVKQMAKHQLATDLDSDKTKKIVAFLNTLTGKYEGVPLDAMKK